MNIGNWLTKWSRLLPRKTAIIDNDREFSYRQLNERTNRLANLLEQRGIGRGERIAALLYNGHEFIELYFAAAKIGAIMVPLNWRMAPPEIAYILNDCEPGILFFDVAFSETASFIHGEVDHIREYVAIGGGDMPWAISFDEIERCSAEEPKAVGEVSPEDAHLLLYTSGTTGFPKGAVLSHRKTFYNALNANIFYGLVTSDIFLVSRPLFHSGGLLVDSTPAFYKGATVIYRRRFTPSQYLETIEKYGVTIIETSATFLNFILQECELSNYRLDSIRTCYTGGERVPQSVLREYHERGIPLSQIFGMTETSILTWLPIGDAVRKVGSVGIPVFHGEVRIITAEGRDIRPGETGEIIVTGPILMSGYWRRPETTREAMRDGWFCTGDLATVDEEGYVHIVDRKRDVFISGGENVYPAEIERTLLQHPNIADVAVYGVSDERWGEVGKASIVPRDRTQKSPQEVLEFLEGKVGRFKIPKYVEFVDKLPRTATGKIQKYLLAEKFKKGEVAIR